VKESVSVRGAIYRYRKDGTPEFLIMRRSLESDNNKGLWQLPGGKLEGSESRERAYVREMKEEVGRHYVNRFKRGRIYLGTVSYLHEEGTKTFIHHGFMQQAQPHGVRLKRSSEHMGHVWVSYSELKQYAFVRGNAELIRRAHEHLVQPP